MRSAFSAAIALDLPPLAGLPGSFLFLCIAMAEQRSPDVARESNTHIECAAAYLYRSGDAEVWPRKQRCGAAGLANKPLQWNRFDSRDGACTSKNLQSVQNRQVAKVKRFQLVHSHNQQTVCGSPPI